MLMVISESESLGVILVHDGGIADVDAARYYLPAYERQAHAFELDLTSPPHLAIDWDALEHEDRHASHVSIQDDRCVPPPLRHAQ